ncbi:MAG: transcriptional regulator [Planctomycetota bacterium]|jgi:DNA-binding transcriptional ArsR family regulator
MPKDSGDAGRYAYAGLERIMHEKARLSILTSLASHPDGLLFTDLRDLCSLTDGNLARHLQALEEASMVEVWKRSKSTLCRLSEPGRERFLEYIAELERVVEDAAAAARKSGNKGAGPLADGWAPA